MLFNKKKKWEPDQYLIDILDAQDADVVIVRGRECKVLFMNSSARKRIRLSALPSYSCKNGYSKIFPRLCHVCSHMEESVARRLPPEIEDQSGNNMFNVLSNPIEWSDGRSATMLMLRDVSEFRNNERKLYHLAYIDQLTGVPNRTRFREDFDNIIDDVNAGKYCGALAIFDLDNFKTINDNYGHATGDTMLQRLAEHLENNANFSGKIYRLGGDEFVILLMEEAKKFPNYEHLRQYYKNIFQDALQSYTMPDIDSACTISMGISFFPQHGRRMSELLRKSDIALYKAKSAGRNRLEIFHDRYDTVKRPKDLYVNMQPILDDTGQTYGYELIDRGNDGQTDYNTVSLSEFNRTLDALGLEDIENDSKFFITFTNQLFHISVRNNLSKDKYITLINAASIKKAEDINLCRDLRKFGYSIALTGIQSADTELLDIVGPTGRFDVFVRALEPEGARVLRAMETVIGQGASLPDFVTDLRDLGHLWWVAFQGVGGLRPDL